MFLKYKIMKRLNAIGYSASLEYFELQKELSPENVDKFMVAVDVLGSSGYLTLDRESSEDEIYISLRILSSYVRYKHDTRISFLNWFLKVASFFIIIATLIFTAG